MLIGYLYSAVVGIVIGLLIGAYYLRKKNIKAKNNIPDKLIEDNKEDDKVVVDFYDIGEHEKIKKKIEIIKDKKTLKKLKQKKVEGKKKVVKKTKKKKK